MTRVRLIKFNAIACNAICESKCERRCAKRIKFALG